MSLTFATCGNVVAAAAAAAVCMRLGLTAMWCGGGGDCDGGDCGGGGGNGGGGGDGRWRRWRWRRLAAQVAQGAKSLKGKVEVGLVPPYPFISPVLEVVGDSGLSIGAQVSPGDTSTLRCELALVANVAARWCGAGGDVMPRWFCHWSVAL
jgi:hypothetical protein